MNDERRLDLFKRLLLFLTHFMVVQKLKTSKPVGTIAEFLVNLMEEKEGTEK